MSFDRLNSSLESILEKYRQSFAKKTFADESSEEDDLMLVFGLSQQSKAANKQYWGRELGMCWELLLKNLFQQTCSNFTEAIDTTHDFIVGKDAIDTKYRIGSGDAKTLRGWRENGKNLIERDFTPVILILRNDSLSQALKACETGGWQIKSGRDSYEYIYNLTQFDLQSWLQARRNSFLL